MDFTSIIALFIIIGIFLLLLRGSKTKYKYFNRNHYGINRNQYGINSTTLKGIPVKSNTEKQIADFLTKKGIAYDYEPKLSMRALAPVNPELPYSWGSLPPVDLHIVPPVCDRRGG